MAINKEAGLYKPETIEEIYLHYLLTGEGDVSKLPNPTTVGEQYLYHMCVKGIKISNTEGLNQAIGSGQPIDISNLITKEEYDALTEELVTKQEYNSAIQNLVTKQEQTTAIQNLVTREEHSSSIQNLVTKEEQTTAIQNLVTKEEYERFTEGLIIEEDVEALQELLIADIPAVKSFTAEELNTANENKNVYTID